MKLESELKTQSMTISEILEKGTKEERKALFEFNDATLNAEIITKFNVWARYYFPKYFKVKQAACHEEMDEAHVAIYRGQKKDFINLAFRGASKTTRMKLFLAFCICCDTDASKRYIKMLSHDDANAKRFVTDIYNMLITVKYDYPTIFAKTETKREETMGSFTTSTGVKVVASTVGKAQRGDVQEDIRPDLIIFDDFETRVTLRSAVTSQMIWANMEEAKNGLAPNGACVYLGNYISELGNVHRLVERASDRFCIVMTTPIVDEAGNLAWEERYDHEAVAYYEETVDDYEGEYLCKPSAAKDIYFPREELEAMTPRKPIKTIGSLKMFFKYNPSQRYGSGHDVAGGVGIDSSTSVFINFDTIPARVVATFADNEIEPEAFGDECYNEGLHFGLPIQAIENNKFDQAVLKAKQLGSQLYKHKTGKSTKTGIKTVATAYGWNTNGLTKSKMLSNLRTAIESGHIDLVDEDLIREAKSYSRNDLIDNDPDVRMTTRHFDLLIACAIAWQMKDEATPAQVIRKSKPPKKKRGNRAM
jgi:hypothetical protein